MKAAGIEKAARRLREAYNHATRLADLERGLDVPKFEYEWFQFLTALNSVFEILGTTARKDPKSAQWWFSVRGPDKYVRKDPLLRFLLHARGSDYHGLDCGAAFDVRGAEYLGYVDEAPFSITIEHEDGQETEMRGGAIHLAGEVESFSFAYKLVPVADQHNNAFDAPTDREGNALPPSVAASLSLEYYSGVLQSAAELSRS